jgi:hypothetical protein
MAAELEDQIDAVKERGPDLKAPAEETTKSEQVDYHTIPQIAKLIEQYPQIDTDDDLGDFLTARAKRLKDANPNISLDDMIATALEATKKAFPAKFGSPTRRAGVEGATPGATNGSGGRAQSYLAMPKEARDMCDEFVADKVMTKEAYVKMFFEADNTRKAR